MGEKILLWFNNEELEQLVKLAGTTDKKQVTKWIKEKALTEIQQSESKQSSKERKEYLVNLKIQLECWQKIRELFPHKTQDEIIEIINGRSKLPEPNLELLQKKELCSHCNHEHNSTTKICNERMCMCGLR